MYCIHRSRQRSRIHGPSQTPVEANLALLNRAQRPIKYLAPRDTHPDARFALFLLPHSIILPLPLTQAAKLDRRSRGRISLARAGIKTSSTPDTKHDSIDSTMICDGPGRCSSHAVDATQSGLKPRTRAFSRQTRGVSIKLSRSRKQRGTLRMFRKRCPKTNSQCFRYCTPRQTSQATWDASSSPFDPGGGGITLQGFRFVPLGLPDRTPSLEGQTVTGSVPGFERLGGQLIPHTRTHTAQHSGAQ